ncbi:hypothetical protein KLP28_09850 [Nocardioidaceae bacterium]|nr:hypothetical protein KLP28_09850 [Nocardioidaceae bacterium]
MGPDSRDRTGIAFTIIGVVFLVLGVAGETTYVALGVVFLALGASGALRRRS